MKCPSCGYVTFGQPESCGSCGAPMAKKASRQVQLALPMDAPSVQAPAQQPPTTPAPGGTKRRRGSRPPSAPRAESQMPLLHVPPGEQPALPIPAPAQAVPVPPPPESRETVAWPAPVAQAEEPTIVDRVEEVPDRFWAPEGAGFLRRAAALFVDQLLLAALFGIFLLGAGLALERAGASSSLLSPAGLRAAFLPLALLAALLSLAYHVPSVVFAGRTPGKALVRLEVRSLDGSTPTWGMAALRWCGGTLGFLCGGVGIAWAFFEPRRRGWADLFSNTVVAERLPTEAGAAAADGEAGAPPQWEPQR